MPIAISEPINHDITLLCGVHNIWSFRRIVETDNTPIIPTAARCQIRWDYGKTLWLEPSVEIDDVEGWITLTVLPEETEGPEWLTRSSGVWDLEVVVDNLIYRWVSGTVTVSKEVTKNGD